MIATGWLGDTIACTAAATSLYEERDFEVDFYVKWPQLISILSQDTRYRTQGYVDSRWGRFSLSRRLADYDLVLREPSTWSYREPFTAEIRRTAGCAPKPEYTLVLPGNTASSHHQPFFRRIAIARDIYKRAYGRDVNALIDALSQQFELVWVGLPPEKSSKRGRHLDLMEDAQLLASADGFVGPEGGLLWLAAGLGVRTVYFTEHIQHVQESIQSGNAWCSLGSINLFPEKGHCALPAYCTNDEALARIAHAIGA